MDPSDRNWDTRRPVIALDKDTWVLLSGYLRSLGHKCVALPDDVTGNSSVGNWEKALLGLYGVVVTRGAPGALVERLPAASVCVLNTDEVFPALDVAVIISGLLSDGILRNAELHV